MNCLNGLSLFIHLFIDAEGPSACLLRPPFRASLAEEAAKFEDIYREEALKRHPGRPPKNTVANGNSISEKSRLDGGRGAPEAHPFQGLARDDPKSLRGRPDGLPQVRGEDEDHRFYHRVCRRGPHHRSREDDVCGREAAAVSCRRAGRPDGSRGERGYF